MESSSGFQSQLRPTARPAYVSRSAEGSGDAELLKILNLTGLELEKEDAGGDTPLRRAARRGEVDVVRILLGRGAKIDAAHETIIYGEYGEVCNNFFGPTALVLAAENGRGEVVKLLIERGANLESADSSGRTALREAADRGHVDVLRILLSHGADIEAVSWGETPLRSAASRGADATAAILIEAGAALEATDKSGRTALHCAARNGRAKVARVLLSKGADINARDLKGKSAIQLAIKKKQLEVVKILAENGADFKAPTGVVLAKLRGWVDPTKEMITRRADVTYKPLGFDPYQLLRSTLIPSPPKGEPAPQRTADVRAVCMNIVSGQSSHQALQKYLMLVSNEDTPAWYRNHLIKAFALAHVCGHYHEAKDLGKLRGDLYQESKAQFQTLKENIHRRQKNSLSLLSQAAENDDDFMVRPLLQLGADLHGRDTSSNTAAMLAASHGNFATYAQLLRLGARADEENFHGFSSLYYVAKAFGNSDNPRGMFQLIRYLGQKGYHFDSPNPASKGPGDAPTLARLLVRPSENLVPGLVLPLLQALIASENRILEQAIDRHDFEGAKASLHAGADRNARNEAGNFPLEIAQLALAGLRNSSASNLKKEYDAKAIVKLLQ